MRMELSDTIGLITPLHTLALTCLMVQRTIPIVNCWASSPIMNCGSWKQKQEQSIHWTPEAKRPLLLLNWMLITPFLFRGSAQTVHIWSSYNKGTIHQVYRDKKLISKHTYFSGKEGSITRPELVVSHVFQQNDSTVWISTNEGLVRLNPILDRFSVYNKWHDHKVGEVRYAALSPNGKLWIATGGYGVYTFDITANQFIDNFRNNK